MGGAPAGAWEGGRAQRRESVGWGLAVKTRRINITNGHTENKKCPPHEHGREGAPSGERLWERAK